MSELYNAIIKVEKTDKCPACHTPLKNVVINPFENAKAELDKLKKIEDAKKRLRKMHLPLYIYMKNTQDNR